MKRRIGLAALTCIELAPPDLVSAAANAGFDCVGLRFIGVPGQVLPRFEQRDLERRLADTGVSVLDVEIFRLEETTDIAQFEPTLALAGRLEASEILVHGADADQRRLADSFARLCELAGKYGLHANVEPMPWVDVSTVAKAKRMIEGTSGALLVDALHFYRADNTLEEVRDLDRSKLRYMQLCDAHPGRPTEVQELIRQARGDRLFPGQGALDLRGLMRALPADLPVCVEVPIAAKMEPFERARQALVHTREFLETL